MQAHRLKMGGPLIHEASPHIENWAAGIGAWEGFGEYTDLVALFTIYNILLHENPQVLWSRSRRAELVRVH